jgi:citrate lyase subunit beta/citryl-CoA lyase
MTEILRVAGSPQDDRPGGQVDNPTPLGVRISVATPEADLSAAVVPGVSTIFYPKVDSPEQVQLADGVIHRLERLRGIRPGTVELCPMIETPQGVSSAHAIASSSSRIRAFGVGPNIHHVLEGDALAYARAECELQALALGRRPLDLRYVPD